jgi:Uma2 family endonuclease
VTTVSRADPPGSQALNSTPPLISGERLTRDEFERRYRAMPPHIKAELVEGVVYVASPVSDLHGGPHCDVTGWLAVYRAFTPGFVGSIDGTVRLDEQNEPQPDIHLRIREEYGGQAKIDEDKYIEGAPELVVEIARSSISFDLREKLEAYRRNGVREYVVCCVDDRAIEWFVLREGRFICMAVSPDGIYRSTVFPGLWLDASALLHGDLATVIDVVQRGVASAEHADFVETLSRTAMARAPESPPTGGDRS